LYKKCNYGFLDHVAPGARSRVGTEAVQRLRWIVPVIPQRCKLKHRKYGNKSPGHIGTAANMSRVFFHLRAANANLQEWAHGVF
tara:strand:- start:3802 stop:4053 length:252 start_codon:yes stop_codon:yes gene_type:complete